MINFKAFLPRNETVSGVMVAKVRPSFDYTRIYRTPVSTTYLITLYAIKEFEYIEWNVPALEITTLEDEEDTIL